MDFVPSDFVEPIFKIKAFITPAIDYTANVESSGAFDISSETPSGYYPLGIVGYNTQLTKTMVRRLFLGDVRNERVYYSINSQNTQSIGLTLVVLYVKNEYI